MSEIADIIVQFHAAISDVFLSIARGVQNAVRALTKALGVSTSPRLSKQSRAYLIVRQPKPHVHIQAKRMRVSQRRKQVAMRKML